MNQQDNLQTILRIIEDETGVNEFKLSSKARQREILWARYIFCRMAKDCLSWTERQIYTFVNIDRTSLIHVQYRHNRLMETNAEYMSYYSHVSRRFTKEMLENPQDKILNQRELGNIFKFNRGMLIGVELAEVRC